MKRRIEKAVVLGAGTIGSRIAAHFANAGLPCILLDIVPPNLPAGAPAAERNKIVRAGLEAAKKSKPAAFFTASLAERIAIGNFEDDLARCAEADWIIEVVAENLEIKRNLLARVAQFRKPGAIVTTNTSGLPVHLIAEGLPEEFQQHRAGSGLAEIGDVSNGGYCWTGCAGSCGEKHLRNRAKRRIARTLQSAGAGG